MMAQINTILHFLHGMNRWLAVLAAAWLLAELILGAFGKRKLARPLRAASTAFLVIATLQALLGAALVLVLNALGAAPFQGHSATQAGHMGGGILAAFIAAFIFGLTRKEAPSNPRFFIALACGVLAFLTVGKLLIALACLIVFILIRFGQSRLTQQPILSK
jgi:hypothetical protein